MIICDSKTREVCKKKKYSCRGCEYYVSDEIRKRAIRITKSGYTNMKVMQKYSKRILTDKSTKTKNKKMELKEAIELDLKAYELILNLLRKEEQNEKNKNNN